MRPSLDYKSSSFTTTVGYRIGKFTPMVGFSTYKEKLTEAYTETQNDNTRFVGVRWDFRKNMDLKVQWDSVKDSSAYDFTKNAKTLSVAFDVLF
jgi:predicted porin